MKRGRAGTGSKLGRIMAAPLRALCRARDLYVGSMVGLAARGSLCGAAGVCCPGGATSGVPRSYRFPAKRAEEDDLAELVRAASCTPKPGAVGGAEVGMARIDEETPCELGLEVLVAPRTQKSRCCPAVRKNRVGIMP